MKKVDFMLIGAMKCGTTTLAKILANHKNICFSNPKETDFFIHSNWENQLDVYHSYFSPQEGETLWGEGSTSYSKFPILSPYNLPESLYRYNPDLKFIYIIRNPIERIISHYRDLYTRGNENLTIEQAVLTKPQYIDITRYYMQILPYLDLFGRTKILILTFESFLSNRDKTISTLSNFLTIPHSGFNNLNIHANKSDYKYPYKVDKILNNSLLQRAKFILPKTARSYLAQSIMSKTQKKVIERPSISTKLNEYVLRSTKDDIRNIEEIIGRELSEWKRNDYANKP